MMIIISGTCSTDNHIARTRSIRTFRRLSPGMRSSNCTPALNPPSRYTPHLAHDIAQKATTRGTPAHSSQVGQHWRGTHFHYAFPVVINHLPQLVGQRVLRASVTLAAPPLTLGAESCAANGISAPGTGAFVLPVSCISPGEPSSESQRSVASSGHPAVAWRFKSQVRAERWSWGAEVWLGS